MTYQEALDVLADDPHVWRYRELTADDHHDPRVRDAWRVQVVRIVAGEPEPAPKDESASQETTPVYAVRLPASHDPWLPLIRACDDHNPACCATPVPYCSRFLKNVSRDQCVLCLKEQGVADPEVAHEFS